MQIIRTFKNVTSDQFFDNLERGLWEDVKNTSKKYRKSEITVPGFTYVKNKSHGAARIDITLLEYERGNVYSIETRQVADYMVVTYHTEDTPEGLKVTMDQYIDSYEKEKASKSKIANWWNQTVYFSRMSQTLLDLITDIDYAKDGIKRPDDSLIPKHYRNTVMAVNKKMLKAQEKKAREKAKAEKANAKKKTED